MTLRDILSQYANMGQLQSESYHNCYHCKVPRMLDSLSADLVRNRRRSGLLMVVWKVGETTKVAAQQLWTILPITFCLTDGQNMCGSVANHQSEVDSLPHTPPNFLEPSAGI